ncbi:HU family DNA-binding protein [Pseudophaeobacter sp.]|uniref:HU family DNA-binding protein n=1 Tax=Pseudophaeobacter sp. TaxID=1971739 RepID=UPI003299308E
MSSSKTGGRKPAVRKTTARKTLPSKSATKARLAETKTATTPQQANEGSPALDISDKTVSPPQALAAGQEPSPVVVTASPVLKEPPLNKRVLIEDVVLRSGVKKKDAKPVVEAMLAVLGETVASGRDLNLKPFGKLHLNRSETRSNGTVHICRLRQPLEQPRDGAESGQDAEISSDAPLAQSES